MEPRLSQLLVQWPPQPPTSRTRIGHCVPGTETAANRTAKRGESDPEPGFGLGSPTGQDRCADRWPETGTSEREVAHQSESYQFVPLPKLTYQFLSVEHSQLGELQLHSCLGAGGGIDAQHLSNMLLNHLFRNGLKPSGSDRFILLGQILTY
jgi:hypothetical protein